MTTRAEPVPVSSHAEPDQGSRVRVARFMQRMGIPVPVATVAAPSFRHEWIVTGTPDEGLQGSYSDQDDQIEFGLLSRHDTTVTNVLHAVLVLARQPDETDRLTVFSDERSDLNFDTPLDARAMEALEAVLDFFADCQRRLPRV
jgi:predicted dithiol-disulfide oxidoreductase (DUF899 family)